MDDGNITLFTSEMARLGCRVKPLRENDDYLLTLYDQFFDNQIESTFQLTRVIIDKATYLRATYGCNTPDAIHLAAAIIHDCDIFLTNDQRLDFSKEIKVEIL